MNLNNELNKLIESYKQEWLKEVENENNCVCDDEYALESIADVAEDYGSLSRSKLIHIINWCSKKLIEMED